MFDMSPAVLISGLLISSLGTAMFVWGKNQEDFLILVAGLALAIAPLVVASVVLLWLITGATFAGVYAYRRFA